MPKRKYASGVEIRHYIEMICSRFDLHRRAMFQSSGRSVEWDEARKEWVAVLSKKPKGRMESQHIVRADFVLFGSGEPSSIRLSTT